MGRIWAVGLAAAACVSGAAPAGAAVMVATFSGEYAGVNVPLGFFPPDQPGLVIDGNRESVGFFQGGLDWSASFTFDTNLGQLTTTDFGNGYSSQTFTGPLTGGVFNGFGIVRDLADATSFSITRDPVGLNFSILGPGYSFHDAWESFDAIPIMAPSLTAPFSASGEQLFGGGYDDGTFIGDDSFVEGASLAVVAVPEPTTWVMMIVGFGGLGAMLRHRRRYAAAL